MGGATQTENEDITQTENENELPQLEQDAPKPHAWSPPQVPIKAPGGISMSGGKSKNSKAPNSARSGGGNIVGGLDVLNDMLLQEEEQMNGSYRIDANTDPREGREAVSVSISGATGSAVASNQWDSKPASGKTSSGGEPGNKSSAVRNPEESPESSPLALAGGADVPKPSGKEPLKNPELDLAPGLAKDVRSGKYATTGYEAEVDEITREAMNKDPENLGLNLDKDDHDDVVVARAAKSERDRENLGGLGERGMTS